MSLEIKNRIEVQNLIQWLGNPPRNPLQTHGMNESDSEIVQLPGGSYLATTTDSISEELALGFYQDPFLMGWLAAQASLSDLAAVGAQPLGLLFSAVWKAHSPDLFKAQVAEGFNAALRTVGTYLLGGDQGTSAATVLSGVGVGICSKKPISRIGIQPGDYFCLTGQTGAGPSLSFRFLRKEDPACFPETYYRPTARVEEGQRLSTVATAMMDTSDGVLSSLHTLALLNGVGLALEWNPETLHPLAVKYCRNRTIPLWMLWVGEHGDFELLSAVAPEKLEEAKALCPGLQVIGRATLDPKVSTLEIHQGMASQKIARPLSFEMAQCLVSGSHAEVQDLSIKLSELIDTFKKAGFP